jgi:hypothetical protein
MADLDKLRSDHEQAEQKAQKLMADRDEALAKVRDRYDDKLRAANEEARDAQKAYCDAEAAQALVGRDDAEIVASNLGLSLPE